MSKINEIIDNINKKGKSQREWLTINGPGTYVIRICQDLENPTDAPFEEFYLHSGFIHPVYQTKSAIKCLGRHCPMCQYAKEYAIKDPSGAWKFKSKQFYLYNVVDRSDGRLKLLKLSYLAHAQITAKIIEAANQGINLMSFFEGRDIQLDVRPVNGKLHYKSYILSEKETLPVSGKLQEEMKFVRPLRDSYRAYTRDELTSIVKGEVPNMQIKQKARVSSKASLIENLQNKVRQSKSNVHISKEEPKAKPAAPSKPKDKPSIIKDVNDMFEDDSNE